MPSNNARPGATQSTYQARNASSNNRSGSNNNRTTATNPVSSGKFNNVPAKPIPPYRAQGGTTKASSSPYSRLYGGGTAASQKKIVSTRIAEDAKREEDPSGESGPVNINIVQKDYNKENVRAAQRPRPPPAVGGGDPSKEG